MHMALHPLTGALCVTLNSRHAMAIVNGTTLAPVLFDPHYPIVAQVSYVNPYPPPAPLEDVAIAQPRTIFNKTVGPDVLTCVLGSRGSHFSQVGPFGPFNQFETGFDLWSSVLALGTRLGRKGLGTKNFNMALDKNSLAAWVVSGDAENLNVKGKAAVAGVTGGFLRTLLHLVEDVTNPTSPLRTLDLNANETGATSLSHCTDVAIFENASTYEVYVTAFNKDAIAKVSTVKAAGGAWNPSINWTKTRLSLSRGAGTFAGPTSLAVKLADAAAPNDPGDRIYVLSRFANAIDVIDPANFTTFASVAMSTNPEPAYIRDGRRFLYSTDRKSVV